MCLVPPLNPAVRPTYLKNNRLKKAHHKRTKCSCSPLEAYSLQLPVLMYQWTCSHNTANQSKRMGGKDGSPRLEMDSFRHSALIPKLAKGILCTACRKYENMMGSSGHLHVDEKYRVILYFSLHGFLSLH